MLKSAFVCKNQRQCQVHNNQFSTAATVSIQVQCLQQKVGCAVQPWTLGHQQPYLRPHNQNKKQPTPAQNLNHMKDEIGPKSHVVTGVTKH